MSFLPSSLRTLVVTALISTTPVFAQTEEANPGLALVKPQVWSKPSEATVLEFQSYADHTAAGTPGVGYYEFVSKQGTKRQYNASQVVKVLVYPEAKSFQDIQDAEARAKLVALSDEINATMKEYPNTSTYLKAPLKVVTDEVAQFDSGKVKIKGVWQDKDTYIAGKIANIGQQLRNDILQAKPPSSFDLSSDGRFLGLQDLAKTSPSANQMVNDLKAQYDKLVRAEQRDSLLNRLAGDIPFAEAQGAVARLESLHPDEDAKTVVFLKRWKDGFAVIQTTQVEAAPLVTAVEAELTPVEKVDAPPKLTPELTTKLNALSQKINNLTATNPPPSLLGQGKQAVALTKLDATYAKLDDLFEQKQYLQAQEALKGLDPWTEAIGPQSVRVTQALETLAHAKVEEFSRLREEAKLLADSGKQAQALEKYQEAFAVMPDEDVGLQITALKKAAPAQP